MSENVIDTKRVVDLFAATQLNEDDYGGKLTHLHKACSLGDVKRARMLIDSGADVNAKNVSKTTPLICACADNHIEVVKLLLESGANVNDKDSLGETAFHKNCSNHGNIQLLELLRSYSANIFDINNEDENAIAVLYSNRAGTKDEIQQYMDCIEYLVGLGLDVNSQNFFGCTQISKAVNKEYPKQAIKKLIKLGADPNIPDTEGFTPLHYAARVLNMDAVNYPPPKHLWCLETGACKSSVD